MDFDLGRDGLDIGNVLRLRVARGIGAVETIHIGQQNQTIRFHHRGDSRRQLIIVAETDFRRRHRVVFVDDWHRPEFQQSLQRGARVQVTPAFFGIIQG